MARNSRQSKILDLISQNEIETQDELVAELKRAKFDVTQATISRDIKELGLIKILSDNKKYKYASVSTNNQIVSNKSITILKECVISVKSAMNLVVLKTLSGSAQFVANIIDQLPHSQILGCTYGDSTVFVATNDPEDAVFVRDKIAESLT